MPKEAFGGGGGDEGEAGRKKPGLSRFVLGPDTNIRDVFWAIMCSYADSGKPGMDLGSLENDRFALMRAALSVISGRQCADSGHAAGDIAEYSVMLMVDGEWEDALRSLLSEGAEAAAPRKELCLAIRRLLAKEKYREEIERACAVMLRERDGSSAALSYIASAGDAGFAKALKKELLIIARGGIGDDQMNAIAAVTLIREDEDVRKSLISLLSHWDSQARLAAAEALGGSSGDREVVAAAAKRFAVESDPDVKRALGKII